MSCHATTEIHGDGVADDSYMLPGVLETRCETCINCHVLARIEGTKDVKIGLQGMLLLVNHNGRVTTANLLTFVYRKKTMITLAPTFSHPVVRRGRTCAECHDTAAVRGTAAATFTPVTWADGKVTKVPGVIPVVDPLAWNLPFLGRANGTWVPLQDPAPPVLHFPGNCSPLTREQLARLSKP